MQQYDQLLFDFIVSKENFEATCDIAEKFPEVRRKLIADFWVEVKVDIENKISQYKGWAVYLDKDVFVGSSKLCLYKQEFCLSTPNVAAASICMEKLSEGSYFGLWADKQSDKLSYQDIFQKVTAEIKSDWRKEPNGWWPLWQHTNINFNRIGDVKRLRPDVRNEMVQEVSGMLMAAFEEFKDFLVNYFEEMKLADSVKQ